MKRYTTHRALLPFVAVALAFTSVSTCRTAEAGPALTEAFTSEVDRFRIEFPAAPTLEIVKITNFKKLPAERREWSATRDGVKFGVTVDQVKNLSDTEENVMDDFRRKIIDSLDSETALKSEKQLTLPGDIEARELQVFLPDSIITMRLRFFVVGKFFYGIAVIGGPAQVENREAEKFVNSFESLDLKAPSKKKRKRSVNGGSSGPIDAKGLQYLQSKIGGFEMYTIAQPKLIQQSNTLPCGDELQMNFFVMGARPSLLLVVHADLQDGMFESERELVETLRSAADTVGREMGGTVRSFQRLPDQNDQAEWSVAIDANEGGSNIRGRMIIRGTRFYQVYAVGSESFVQSRTAVTALDSFDLL